MVYPENNYPESEWEMLLFHSLPPTPHEKPRPVFEIRQCHWESSSGPLKAGGLICTAEQRCCPGAMSPRVRSHRETQRRENQSSSRAKYIMGAHGKNVCSRRAAPKSISEMAVEGPSVA
ncbi:unnamed protein product [Arctogadus glacialis]